MIELRKLVVKGLSDAVALPIFLPSTELSGELPFPLLTLEITQSDGGQVLNHDVYDYSITFEIYFFSDDVEYILTHENLIKEYFHSLGIKMIYESKVSRSHHWFKQYQFRCTMQVKDENYIIL